MPAPLRAASVLVWCCTLSLCFAARAQTGAEARTPGTITGRVTSGEKGVGGVSVALLSSDVGMSRKPLVRGKTDAEGRYTLANVAPGRYSVLPVAPAYVVPNAANTWPPGKVVNLAPGETVEDIDFDITRGGVITGRVTDGDGRPIIGQHVEASQTDAQPGRMMRLPIRMSTEMTDDRGVYRIYGLPAGKYRVSVGQDTQSTGYISGARPIYTRTFHPGVTEEREAKIVEVAEGGEAADVDITVGAMVKTYKASGRLVEAETGRPVTGVSLLFGAVREHQPLGAGGINSITTADGRGEFQMNVLPGRYGVAVSPSDVNEWYSDTVTFDVADADVSGLEVKARRGSGLGGVVVLEGGNAADRSVAARVAQLRLYVTEATPPGPNVPTFSQVRINSDNTFVARGLRPGKVRLDIANWMPQVKGFQLLRVERGGADVREGVEIKPGEFITDLRVVVTYGSAVVRGQVRVEGGPLPDGSRMIVMARRTGGGNLPPVVGRPSEVDARGRFEIEGLAAGEYELSLRVFGPNVRPGPRREVKQTITVGDSGEVPVTLVYNSKEPEQDAKP